MDVSESCSSRGSEASPLSIRRRRQKVEVFQEVLRRLREANVEEVKGSGFEDQLWNHFSRLPLRYALDVNVETPENVLMHKKMLHMARDTRVSFELRLVEIRPIYDAPPHDDLVPPNCGKTANSTSYGSVYPPPAFGTSSTCRSAFEANNIYMQDGETSVRGNSLLVRYYSARPLHEITISMKDKPKLLSKLTHLLSEICLNIQEAHAFSTLDGYSLDVFIVDGWPYEKTDQLKNVLVEKIPKIEKQHGLDQKLEFASEKFGPSGCKLVPNHEDSSIARNSFWEIDFNLLTFLNKVSTWSNSDLFKGMLGSQDVAIKIIRTECLNEDVKNEFAQEVSILSKIKHENIVRLIGACSKPPFLCIVTEFVSGGSLYDFLHKDKGKFTIPDIVKIAIEVSNGMCYLHEKKIIHRDLKAANLLMDDNGVVKISDFGVARVQVEDGIMTAETGTYRWMAPEVIEHMPYDHKADVFSFGIVLWELLTGELPYVHLTPLQAAVGVIQKGLRPTVPGGTHPVLTLLLERCWQKQPSSRPEFLEIKEILQQLAKEVGREDKSEQIGKRRRDSY